MEAVVITAVGNCLQFRNDSFLIYQCIIKCHIFLKFITI